MTEEDKKTEDPRIDIIYNILCCTQQAPAGESWEEFVAKRILAALDDLQTQGRSI